MMKSMYKKRITSTIYNLQVHLLVLAFKTTMIRMGKIYIFGVSNITFLQFDT